MNSKCDLCGGPCVIQGNVTKYAVSTVPNFLYKWTKLFASKRYNTKDGVIKLTVEEQQELLDDLEIRK